MQRYLFGIKKESASFGDYRNDKINEDNNNIMTEMWKSVCWILYLIGNDFICTMVYCNCKNDEIPLLIYASNNGFRWVSDIFNYCFGYEKFHG